MFSIYMTFTASKIQRVINTPSLSDAVMFALRLRTGAGCRVRIWSHKQREFLRYSLTK